MTSTSARRAARILLIAALSILLLTAAGPQAAGARPVGPVFALDVSAAAASAAPAQAGGPHLALATYIGGGRSDYGRAVAADAQGNIFIAADLFSEELFGLTRPVAGARDVLVLKLSPDGRQVLAGGAFGSSGSDEVIAMAVTAAGEPVLTILPGAAWPTQNALHAEPTYGNEGVLVKLTADLGDFVFSTYTQFNMSNSGGQNIALDPSGAIYVTGDRYVAERRARDLIVQKYRPDGQALLYELLLDDDQAGEEGRGIAVGADGAAYVTGVVSGYDSDLAVTPDAQQPRCGAELARGPEVDCGDDAFVAVLDPAGALRYASYLGGDGADSGVAIAVDAQGGMAIVGSTTATNFPTTAGALLPACKVEDTYGCYYDTFLTRLRPDGSIAFSSFLNSDDASSMDFTNQVAFDPQGNVVVAGRTSGEAFPVQSPVQAGLAVRPCASAFTRFCYDSFVSVFGPDGALRFSSYLGGSSDEETGDIFAHSDGSLYLIGTTESPTYPVTANAPQAQLAGGSDIFLAHIAPQPEGCGAGCEGEAPGPFRVGLPLVRGR